MAQDVLTELAMAVLNVRLNVGGPMTSSSAQEGDRPPGSLVGRERELAELRAGLADVAAGHGT
jgi:hypothetical protein